MSSAPNPRSRDSIKSFESDDFRTGTPEKNPWMHLTTKVCPWLLETYHGDIVAIEQDLIELGDSSSLRRALVLGHVFQVHVDEVVEPEQRAHDLFVVLHDDVNARSNSFVHQL